MNRLIKFSLMEDFKTIKGGYRPQNHFCTLYNIITIFVVFNLLITQSFRNYFHMISQNTHGYSAKNNNIPIQYVRKDVTKLTK